MQQLGHLELEEFGPAMLVTKPSRPFQKVNDSCSHRWENMAHLREMCAILKTNVVTWISLNENCQVQFLLMFVQLSKQKRVCPGQIMKR